MADTKKQEENYDKKYTAFSRADVETALNNGESGINAVTSNTTQAETDRLAGNIVTAVNNLKLQKYTVTLNVIDIDNDIVLGTKVYELLSGDNVDVNIDDISVNTSSLLVYKWTQSYDDNSSTKKLNIKNRYVTHYLDSKNVVYDVYLTNSETPNQIGNRVLLYCHNQIYDIAYVHLG